MTAAQELEEAYDPRFRRMSYDVLLEVFLSVDAAQWRRRARQLEAARSRPGDYTGRATIDERAARDRRLTEAAAACRNRARLVDASRAQMHDTLADLAAGTPA